uniref:Angel homolog 1 n=1 Tax=Nothobranchius korthausae TaxID=1143690 RepID=A0A1A8FCS2_9TELE
MNEEPLMAVLLKDTINDVAADTCEIHSASKEKVETPKLEDGEIVGHHLTKCTDGESINAGGISPQEELLISGQEDPSYKHCYRHLLAPLWPDSLGINDLCQYTANTSNHTSESTSQKSEKRQYTREFILQFRYCPAACVRPQDLILIPGVTNINPDDSRDDQQQDKRFRHILRHMLDLESVYKHFLPRSGCPEITTLHAEGGSTVDYIFYSAKRDFAPDQKAYGKSAGGGLKLTGFLSLLSEDVLWSMNGLPNHIFPSDHLSLLARFQLDINAD